MTCSSRFAASERRCLARITDEKPFTARARFIDGTPQASLELPLSTKAGSVLAHLERGPARRGVSGTGLTKPRLKRGFRF
jgi:hypothetical protein